MKLQNSGTISDYLPSLENVGSDKFIEKLYVYFLDATAVLLLLIHSTAISSFFTKIAGAASWVGIFWYIGILCSLILFFTNLQKNLKALIYAFPFLILNAWIIASFTWSVNQAESIRAIIFITSSQIGAISFAVRYKWEKMIFLIAISLIPLVCFSVLLAIADPALGTMQDVQVGAWSGMWMEKQFMGIFSVHLLIAATVLGLNNSKYRYMFIFVPISLLAIAGTTGKSALIMLMAALASIGFVFIYKKGTRTALFITWFTIITATLISIIYIFFSDEVFQLLGRSKDLTGRTEVWEGVDYVINMKFMLGWGYGTIWREQTNPISAYQWISDIAGFTPMNAHSSFKDAHLQIGFIGMLFLIFTCIYTALNTIISINKNTYAAMFGLATISSILFISFTETALMNPMDMQWFFIVALGTKLAMPDEKVSIKKSSKQIENNIFTYQ